MPIQRLEMLLLNIKLLTVLGAAILTGITLRSARRRSVPWLAYLAGGVAAIGVGAGIAFVGGFLVGPTTVLWVLESVLLLIGLGLLLAAIYL